MDSGKEAAANVGASARAGMEKTRAAVQGQVDKVAAYTVGDREAAEVNREAAEVRKQQRVRAAEEDKQRAMRENAAAKERAAGKEDKETETKKETETETNKETETETETETKTKKETETDTETKTDDHHRDRPAIGGVVEE